MLIAKSTEVVTIVDKGKMTFGKQIFLIMFSLLVSELLAEDNDVEKKVQKTKPQRTNKGQGRLPEGILTKLPKKTVKTIIETKGWNKTQVIPRTVCL